AAGPGSGSPRGHRMPPARAAEPGSRGYSLVRRGCSRSEGLRVSEFRNLHDFAKKAKAHLAQGEWDYLRGGAETETSLRRNRMGLDGLAFRPRVLNDVSDLDASTTFLGHRLRIPVLLAPLGSIQLFDPAGAAAIARATSDFGTMMILSSVCEPSFEEVAKIGTGPKIYQLYLYGDRAWADEIIGR